MIDYRTCCRLCLKTVKSTINCIQVTDLCEKIERLTSIKISEGDCYSKSICRECSYQITNFAIFRDTILNNQKTLEKYRNLDLMLENIKSEDSDDDVIILKDVKTEVTSSTRNEDVTASTSVDSTIQNISEQENEDDQIQNESSSSSKIANRCEIKRKDLEFKKGKERIPRKKLKVVSEPLKESDIIKIKSNGSKSILRKVVNRRKSFNKALEVITTISIDDQSQSRTNDENSQQAKATTKPVSSNLDNVNDGNDGLPLYLLKKKCLNKPTSIENQSLEKPISNKCQLTEKSSESTNTETSPTEKNIDKIDDPKEEDRKSSGSSRLNRFCKTYLKAQNTRHHAQPKNKEQVYPILSLTVTETTPMVCSTASTTSCSPLIPTSSTSKSLTQANVSLEPVFTTIPVSSIGHQTTKSQTVILRNLKAPVDEAKQTIAKLVSSPVNTRVNLSAFSTLDTTHKNSTIITPSGASSSTVNNTIQSDPKKIVLIQPETFIKKLVTNNISNSTINLQGVSLNQVYPKQKSSNRSEFIPPSVTSLQHQATINGNNDTDNNSNLCQDHRVKILTVRELYKPAIPFNNQQQQQDVALRIYNVETNSNSQQKRLPMHVILLKSDDRHHIKLTDQSMNNIDYKSLSIQEKIAVRESLLREPMRDKLAKVIQEQSLHTKATELLILIGLFASNTEQKRNKKTSATLE